VASSLIVFIAYWFLLLSCWFQGKLIRNVLDQLRGIVLDGGEVYWEWPRNCQGWQLAELQQFAQFCFEHNKPLHKIYIDGCMFNMKSIGGNPILKMWTVWTTEAAFGQVFEQRRRCNGQHRHDPIQGRTTCPGM
jgi:hypothetical protein